MAYTATITEVIRDYENDKMAKVTVSYTDGVKTIEKVYRISDPKGLKQIVRDQVTDLVRADELEELVSNPPLGVVTLTDPTPKLTVAQKIADLKNEARDKLAAMKTEVALGITTQAAFDAKVNEYKAAIIALQN